MADIILKMTSPSTYTYHIKVRSSFSDTLSTPVTKIEMPEADASRNQITKIEGNSEKFQIVWILDDWTGKVPALVDELTGPNAILTIKDQINFLRKTIQKHQLAHGSIHCNDISSSWH